MSEQREQYNTGQDRPERLTCPKCGNDAAGLDLYSDRGGDDTIVCRKCGVQLRGLDYPALLDYLYDRRNRQAD